MSHMTPEDFELTALLTRGVPIFTVGDVSDELPEAFTEPLDDGADRPDLATEA
jgi:hypothetical protein